VQVPIP